MPEHAAHDIGVDVELRGDRADRPVRADGTITLIIVLSSAAIRAAHRRTRRDGVHTRSRGNFSGTLIPYARAVLAQSLALAVAHVGVGEVLALGVAHRPCATHRTTLIAAVALTAVALAADPEHRQTRAAALLAKRLHRGRPLPTRKTCPGREERRGCTRSASLTPSRAEPRLRVSARGLIASGSGRASCLHRSDPESNLRAVPLGHERCDPDDLRPVDRRVKSGRKRKAIYTHRRRCLRPTPLRRIGARESARGRGGTRASGCRCTCRVRTGFRASRTS